MIQQAHWPSSSSLAGVSLVCARLWAETPGIQLLQQQARAAASRKDYTAAASLYEKILKLDPSLHEARSNLGMMQLLDDKIPQSAEAFRKTLSSILNFLFRACFSESVFWS